MSKLATFSLGGLGGILPILVGLITVDIASIVDHHNEFTVGVYVGYGVRVLVLIALGGIIAVLNKGVSEPLTLVQLGVAAPALITSYINSAPVAAAPKPPLASISIISPAYAEESMTDRPIQLAGGFFADVVQGAGTRLDAIPQRGVAYPNSPAPAGGTGAYCLTLAGRFGPGQANALGSACNVNGANGQVVR